MTSFPVHVAINPNLCSGCTLCLQVCPDRAIGMENNVAKISKDTCLFCGHCAAVCPEEAIRLEGLPRELKLQSLQENEQVIQPGEFDVDALVRLMRSRRSCRRFREKAVARELLEDLVKIGITAPSGTNSQGWTFTLLPERKDVQALGALTAAYYSRLNRAAANPLLRIASRLVSGRVLQNYYEKYYKTVKEALEEWQKRGTDRLFHGAPAAILVGNSPASSCPAEDAMLATQNILLAAHAMGLGTCLIGFAVEAMRRDQRIGRKIGLERRETIYAVIAIGFPRDRFLRPAPRKLVEPRIWSV